MNEICNLSDEIFATYNDVDLFCQKVEKAVNEFNLDKEMFSLQLMLREGLINAVKHGCQNNELLKIKCSFIIYDNEYIIVIEDPGDGFDMANPRNKSAKVDTSGRGLAIMRNYSNILLYNEKGNKLTIRKLLENRELTMGENIVVRDGSRGVLKLESNLVASAVEDLRTLVKNNIQEGLIELTIDLKSISIVDSMGIGFLISAHNSLLKVNGKIIVLNVMGEILDLFKSMRLDQHFSIEGV